MKKYNFDCETKRNNTDCLKYDFAIQRGKQNDMLPLWVADMDFVGCNEVKDAIINASQDGIFGYTDTLDDYFKLVHDWYKNYFDFEIKKESLVKCPGVVYALCTAVKAYTNEFDGVMITEPVYHPFRDAIEVNNRKVVNVELIYKDGKYSMDFDLIEKKIIENKVKLFLLCSPHNPSGRVWTKEELKKLGDICIKHNCLVFSDEIHSDFTYEPYKHYMFTSIDESFKKIALIGLAPSKTFNIAGLQVSHIIIDNEELRNKFINEINKTGYSQLNKLGLVASKACYQYGREWLVELKEYLKSNLDLVREEVSKIEGMTLVEPQGTFLLWIDCSKLKINKRVSDFIAYDCKLWVNDGISFSQNCENFIRINIGTQKKNIIEAFKRINLALKK